MTLFRNSTHSEIWRQKWCETCFEKHEAMRRIQGKQEICPIWEQAIRTDRKPPSWDRNTRADEMHRTITCNAYQAKPPQAPRGRTSSQVRKTAQHFENVPLFDETPYRIDVGYVPVDGWPDRPRKGKDVDHA